MTVATILQLPVRARSAVRVVGVVSRCRNCQREFRTALDADGRVPIEALVCGDPRCQAQTPEPPRAA